MAVHQKGYKSAEDQRLIDAFLAGEKCAVDQVCTWIRTAIHAKSWYGLIRDAEDDICQETLVALPKALSEFRGDCALETYVVRITMRKGIDACRKIRPDTIPLDKILETPSHDPDPLQQLIEREDHQETDLLAEEAFAGASPICRDIWRMYFFEGQSYEEIARKMHIAENTVKTRAHRCKKKIMPYLRKNPRLRRMIEERERKRRASDNTSGCGRSEGSD